MRSPSVAGHERSGATVAADTSTFAPGLRLMRGEIGTDVSRLYRVLRTLDDLVDEGDRRAPQRVEAIERWVHGHEAESPEVEVFADLARRYPLERDAVLEFCTGMHHDLAARAIETEADLDRYCRYVGGSVGVMLTALLGSHRPEAADRMATLGAAMQRTNILRDIDEDFSHGHVYIARTTIERFGFPTPGAREELLRDQIGRADALYDIGLDAIGLLRNGQRAMYLSATLYREILRQIEREGFGRGTGRAVVPHWRRQLLKAKTRVLGPPPLREGVHG
ncbi:MAG TPA: phytoene/squalene synthase family protein [Solirubrobacteraceae bacterium]|jgi:phytoene synthase|nr:phytoene/squalene synthase family protein [Solirubrobacteraceae bacterium]